MTEELARRRLFREVNERIRSVNLRFGTAAVDVQVLCECGRPDCVERIEVPASVYEEIRESDDLFLVADDHVAGERIVAGSDGYAVVAAAVTAAA